MSRSRMSAALVGAALAILLCGPAGAEHLSLRFQAGMLLGLRAGREALPAPGMPGGFYAQRYEVRTGDNLLPEATPEKLPAPPPAGFSVDRKVRWEGKPTFCISLPEDQPADSGELEVKAKNIHPHHIYLLRFAHRGARLGGDFPPIVHIREWTAEGKWACPQLNVDLLYGTYDWKEEVVAIPAVEGAASLSIMVHHPRGTGRFWMSALTLREVQPQPTALVPGMWRRQGNKSVFRGQIPNTGVTLLAAAQEGEDRIHVTVTLAALTDRLREQPAAMVVGFRLPLEAEGWRWGDYLHRERRIAPGRDYSHTVLIGRKTFREVSWFPMAPVSGPEHGIALTAPLTPPLLGRARYDHRGYLCLEWDLGMAARSTAQVERVQFSFDIVRYPPRWGFRGALAKYYELYPALFASTAKRGGWFDGHSERMPDLREFGIQYVEAHFAQPATARYDNQHGLYTCSYSEPWMWRIPVSEENDKSRAKPLATYLPKIEADADLPPDVMDKHDYWTAPRRDSVRAFLNSAIYGPDGEYSIKSIATYGAGTFIELNTSCLPRIRSKRWGEMNRALLSYRYETQADVARCAAAGARVEGVYFDSVGNWSDIAAEDHRAEHFRFASFPLTFSYATGKPVISGLAAMAEYMEFIRRKGFITMANTDPPYVAYAAPYLDMLGAGENYGEPFTDDEALCHDRAVAYHKSVSFGNGGMLGVPTAEAEKRFRLLLFYQVYPGIFARDPAPVERVLPLYRKYMPLMQKMGAAGWEPIPWAAADSPDVWVERYGPGRGDTVYLALRNHSDEPVATYLTVEPAGFGRTVQGLKRAAEALTGRKLLFHRMGARLRLSVSIPAGDTTVVALSWTR